MIQYNLNGREGNLHSILERWRFLFKKRGDNHGSKDFQLERKDGFVYINPYGGTKRYQSRDALGKYPPYTDYRKLVFDLNNSMHTRQKNDLL